MGMTDGESINHWCKWHLQLHSLALGQTAFVSVAGSTIHASTCKGHCNRWLNGWRSKSQAYTESTTTKSHHSLTKPHRSSQARVKNGFMNAKWDATQQPTQECRQRVHSTSFFFTCVTFIGVKRHRRGPLRAGAGVSTRPEETEVTAHILTRVGYWRGESKKNNTVRYCSEQKKVVPGNTPAEVN